MPLINPRKGPPPHQYQTLAVHLTASQREKGPVYVGILNGVVLRPTFHTTSGDGVAHEPRRKSGL
jgi:hypothetical protein